MPAVNNENGVGFVEEPLLPSQDLRALQIQEIQKEGGTVIYVGRNEKIMLDKALKDMQSSRSVIHPTSYVETLIHLLKGNIGGGTFAMGDAFKNAGLLAGTIMIIFIGSICINCNHLLANCAQIIRIKKKLLDDPTFPETVEMCFENGPHSFRRWTPFVRVSVRTFILITQLGFCSVYFVFVASTAQLILQRYGVDLDLRIYMVMMFPVVAVSCLIRNIKYLTPISLLSNILLFTGVILTLVLASQDLPPISARRLVSPIKDWPLFIATTVFSFEGISLVIPLKNEMKRQHHFVKPFGVLNVGMGVIMSLLFLLGFIGYLKYGDDVEGSLTLNLPDNHFSESVQIMVALGIVFSYALQFFVAADLLWKDLDKNFGPFKYPLVVDYILRICLICVTLILAAVVPHLNLFISLVGAVSSSCLAIVYPPLCDIALRMCPLEDGPIISPHQWLRLSIDGLTLVVAAICFVLGSYCSISQIIEAFVT